MKVKDISFEKCNIVFLMLICLTHGTVYWYEGNKYLSLFKGGSVFLLFFVIIFNIYFFCNRQKEYLKKELIVVFFFKIIEIIFYNNLNIKENIFLIIILIIFMRKNYFQKIKFYCYLENLIFIFCLLGIIEYILYIKLDIHPTFQRVYNFRKVYGDYFLLGILNSYLVIEGIILERMQLFFSEPGELGTLLGIFLLFSEEKFNLKKLIIVLSGLLTLSTAFIYFFFMKMIVSIKFRKKIIIVFFSFIFYIIMINQTDFSKSVIYERTVLKIEKIIKNRNLDRISSIEGKKIIEDFYFNGNLIFGERAQGMKILYDKKIRGVSGLSLLLYERGILGLILKIGLILIISDFFYLKNKKSKLMILILLSSIIQRPEIDDIIYFPILYSGPIFFDSVLKKNIYKVDNKKNK